MKNLRFPFNFSQTTSSAVRIVCAFLVFLSIIPLASADVWSEAIILSIIFLLSGLQIWIKPQKAIDRQLLVPLYILAGYSFLQGFTTFLLQIGVSPDSSFFFQSFEPLSAIRNACRIFALALFFKLLLTNFSQKEKYLTGILLFTGNFFVLFGLIRYFFQPDFPVFFEYFLPSQLITGIGFGTYFNQNHFAYLMLMVFGLNISLFWYGSELKKWRLLLLAANFMAWSAIVLTGSRGGIIGSFTALAVLIVLPLIFINRQKDIHSKRLIIFRQMAILTVVFGILTVGIFLVGQERVVERFEDIPQQISGTTDPTTFRRTDAWLAATAIFKDFPIFGIGFGGYSVAVSRYIDISGQLVPQQAHNDYLELAASGGIIAVGIAAWFIFLFFSAVKKRFYEPADSFSLAVRGGAICGMAGVAIHSLFDFGLQITANQLFFIALSFLAIHQTENKSNEIKTVPKSKLFKILLTFVCGLLALFSAYYGVARFYFELIKKNPNLEFAEKSWPAIPFDAEYFLTKGSVYESFGKTELAAVEYQKAVKYRPKDYKLWLNSARTEQMLNNDVEADIAFRRSIELAPRFAEPHLLFGKFLVKANRFDEGFTELRFAARRNPKYFDGVSSIVWQKKDYQADELIKFFSPLEQTDREQLVLFLFEKKSFPPIVRLVCREEYLPPAQREELIRKFYEKQLFRFAEQIYDRNCENPDAVKNNIEDGSFENKNVREGKGFGWRILSITDYTKVSYDEENGANGQSLRFDFNGQEPSYALLSQIVTIEKNRRYQLKFSTKTRRIVTGGVPVLQIVFKQTETEYVAKEIKLPENQPDWIQIPIDFETSAETQAIEIRLTRNSCGQPLCPIFGTLWLDDFTLQAKN